MRYLILSLFILPSFLFSADVPLKFLEDNCAKCHNPKKHKGGVDFSKYKTQEDFWKDAKTWKTSIEMVQTGEMPPKKELTNEQIEYFTTTVATILDSDNFKVEDWYGRAILRRLSPVEIEHSLSDISGVKFDIAKNFPIDSGGGEGFSNNADTMRLTPVFFEKLSVAAEKFASHAEFNPSKGIVFKDKSFRPLTNEQFYVASKVNEEDFYNSRSAKMIRHESRSHMEKYMDALCDLMLRQRKTDFDSVLKFSKENDLVGGAVWQWVEFLSDPEAAIKKRKRMGYWNRWAFKPFNEAWKNKVTDPEKVKEVAIELKHRIRFFFNNQHQVFSSFREKHLKIEGKKGLYRITVGPMHDGDEHDYVNLENAYFQLKDGKKVYLTSLAPQHIQGQVHIGKNGKGEEAKELGSNKKYKHIIGFKAPAQVFFEIPEGAKWFKFDAHMDAASQEKGFVQIIADSKDDKTLVKDFIPEGILFAGQGARGASLRSEVDGFSLYMQYLYYPGREYIDRVISQPEKDLISEYKKNKNWAWELNNYTWRAFARKYKLKDIPNEESAAKLGGKAGKSWKKHRDNVNYFKDDVKKRVAAAISDFGLKLFRKPLEEKEVNHWLALFDKEFKKNGNLQQTIQELVVSMVLHPSFIYRFEKNTDGKVSDYELATRLSYFLWSSSPDKELLELAKDKKLSEGKVLNSQIDRMLKDKKSQRLGEQFFLTWLHAEKIYKDKIPNKEIFPEYNAALREDMVQEVKEFANYIVSEDQPVHSIISADYSFVNERLANHYGIKNFTSKTFKKVDLKAHNRGGVLGMGAIHVISSYPERTSPVLRGQWILETLIGAPVPPPPEDVEIAEATMIDKNLSIKEKLQKHREVQSCAICHDRIDPLGFSMENFDAIGRWRTEENSKPIDTEGELKGGVKLAGVQGLKGYLSSKGKDDFVKHFTEKLLGFGLGRGLDYPDRAIVRNAVERTKKNDYKFSELVKGLIESPAFLERKTPRELSKID